MNTKLTLKLEDSIILKAKKYAHAHGESLSKLVENFFQSITEKNNDDAGQTPPTVKSLMGILKENKRNYEDEYTNYLEEKYSS